MKQRVPLYIAFLFCLVFFVLLLANRYYQFGWMMGDQAIFLELASRIAHQGEAVSNVFAGSQALIESQFFSKTSEQICHAPLTPPEDEFRPMLRFHAYFLYYLLSLPVKFIPVEAWVALLHVGSFVGLLIITGYALYRRSLSFFSVIAFLLFVIVHPAWQLSFLGQFYPDRLFLLFGTAFVWAISSSRTKPLLLIIITATIALLSERSSLVGGLFCLGCALLNPLKEYTRSRRAILIAVGLVLLAWTAFLMKGFLSNLYFDTFMPRTIAEIVLRFSNEAFRAKAIWFVLVCSIPLGVIAVWNPRSFLIAGGMLLPNILGNIGGAEKVGWLTHYHSYYFPFLVWAAALGWLRLSTQIPNISFLPVRLRFGALPVASVAVSLLLFCVHFSEYTSPKLSISAFNDGVFGSFYDFVTNTDRRLSFFKERDELRKELVKAASVSTVEGAMPWLYQDRRIFYYPIGIDESDAVVIPFDPNKLGNARFRGIPTYLGPQEEERLTECITQRLQEKGFLLNEPKIFPQLGVAVLRRD